MDPAPQTPVATRDLLAHTGRHLAKKPIFWVLLALSVVLIIVLVMWYGCTKKKDTMWGNNVSGNNLPLWQLGSQSAGSAFQTMQSNGDSRPYFESNEGGHDPNSWMGQSADAQISQSGLAGMALGSECGMAQSGAAEEAAMGQQLGSIQQSEEYQA